MAAIITDQIRILNAKNFVSGVQTSTNAYYSFIGGGYLNDISGSSHSSIVVGITIMIFYFLFTNENKKNE